MAERRPDRTLGPGHDLFWAHCDAHELHLPRCTACAALIWPIAPACPACGGTDLAWERLSGRGTIVSWCTFEHDYYAGLLPIPWETILVELAEGPLFVSNPVAMTHRDLRVGVPVHLALIPCEDSAGPFSLPVFAADQPPEPHQEPMP